MYYNAQEQQAKLLILKVALIQKSSMARLVLLILAEIIVNIIRLMTIDLHNHSYYSDGVLSPSEVVCLAKESGCNVFALTKH
jgi:hypothetical protein